MPTAHDRRNTAQLNRFLAKTTWLALALLATTTQVQAATITQTQPYGLQPTPFNESLSFNRFNPAQGTLQSVTWSLSLSNSGGDITLDNDAATAAFVQYDIGSRVSLQPSSTSTSPQLPRISTGASFVRTINLAADDGDGVLLDATAPDGAFRTRTFPQSSSINNQRAFAVNGYVGATPFLVEADVTNVAPISFISGAARSDIQVEVSPVDTSGVFTLVYNFAPVPEPATGSLVALGVAGILGVRKRLA